MSNDDAASKEYGDKAWRDVDVLRELYVEQGMTLREVGDELGCSGNCVSNWMDKLDVGKRKQGHTRGIVSDDTPWRDKQLMKELYEERGLSQPQIADELDCEEKTVFKWLHRHEIEQRGTVVDTNPDVPPELKDKSKVEEWYVDQGKTTKEIAETLNCGDTTVCSWMDRHGIERRPKTETHARENNGMWIDGRWSDLGYSDYGPGFNETKKEKIRTRDDHQCRICGMSNDEHRERYNKRLDVHHLNKAANVDDPAKRNAEENLVTVCKKCHAFAEKMAPLLPQSVSNDCQ